MKDTKQLHETRSGSTICEDMVRGEWVVVL